MAMNVLTAPKQGVIFTLMAIVVASIIILSVDSYSTPTFSNNNPALLRVLVIDSTIDSFLTYVEESLVISTQKSMTNISRVLAQQDDQYMSLFYASHENFVKDLYSCIFDSGHQTWFTAVCNEPSLPELLDNYTLLVLENLNINITYAFDSDTFTVTQTTPFLIDVSVEADIVITDTIANWTLTQQEITVQVPTREILDPVMAKFAANTTATTPSFEPYYFQRFDELLIDASAVYAFGLSHTYIAAPNRGPSVLDRYLGDFGPNECCGIEAILTDTGLLSEPWTNSPGLILLSGGRSNYSFIDHELLYGGPSPTEFAPITHDCRDTVATDDVFFVEWIGGDSSSDFFIREDAFEQFNIDSVFDGEPCS